MTKCEEFVDFVDFLIANCKEPVNMTENVSSYLEALRTSDKQVEKKEFTENGKNILQWLQEAAEGMYKSRDIAEGMGISSRTVSGAIRKLVTDGYVEKIGKEPVVYSITEKGKNVIFNEGENE